MERGSGTARRARWAVAVAVACAAVALWAAAGGVERAAADAPQVTIVTPGGAVHTLALEALAGSEDVVGRTYVLRSATGVTSQTVTGFSVAALIEAAGVDPYGFSYLEVQRPGGRSVQLSSTQALAPNAFPEGPPVVWSTGGGTGFLRPGAGPGDDNAGDSFEAPQGLTIALRKGTALRVRAEATPRKTVPGKKVSLRAIVERAGSGEALTYSWYFDDGASGRANRSPTPSPSRAATRWWSGSPRRAKRPAPRRWSGSRSARRRPGGQIAKAAARTG